MKIAVTKYISHSIFDRLHSQQPSFGPACCLTKRWLSAHFIDNSHMPDIVVELLLASIYLTPEPYTPVQTPQVAFMRFLELFMKSHWSAEPVIINFNSEMSSEYDSIANL